MRYSNGAKVQKIPKYQKITKLLGTISENVPRFIAKKMGKTSWSVG